MRRQGSRIPRAVLLPEVEQDIAERFGGSVQKAEKHYSRLALTDPSALHRDQYLSKAILCKEIANRSI